jgi:hypothetical protein
MRRTRRYTDEQLVQAVSASRNLHSLLISLGLSPRGGNYETVRRHVARLGIDAPHLAERHGRGTTAIRASDDEIRIAVQSSRSFADVLRKIGHRPGGRSQANLKCRVAMLGLDTSHFTGAGWRRGSTTPVLPAAPLEEFLVDGRLCQTATLKRRLIQAGLKRSRCEACGNTAWNGSPIPLELDHINGRREDNRLANLRLLCPNCHAQTPTYRGRNIGTGAGIL